MKTKEVKIKVPEHVHEELKRLVKEGGLREAGIETVSDAYTLAAILLLKLAEKRREYKAG